LFLLIDSEATGRGEEEEAEEDRLDEENVSVSMVPILYR